MDKPIKTSRILFLGIAVLALIAAMLLVLYDLQAVEADNIVLSGSSYSATTSVIQAARGSIFDTNGTLLASDRPVYNITISRSALLKEEAPNDTVLTLIRGANSYGVQYEDTFPVTMSAPFEYSANATERQRSRLATYIKRFNLKEDISATDLITWMRDHYKISFTVPGEDARRIIGVRYELEIRALINTTEYIFARDVSTEYLTFVLEARLPSVLTSTTYVRQYHTAYASHVLGSVGAISAENAEEYKAKGYSLDAIVGKSGVESAFEEYLRGTPGTIVTYKDADGAIADVQVKSEAKAGGNVYLSIDIGLEEASEKAIAANIAKINEDRLAAAQKKALESGEEYQEPELAEGGSVVVMDVKTGKLLASVSYPSYDMATYRQNYSTLAQDPLHPLWNRATQSTYEPGSTYKMVTALAALKAGTITTKTVIHDEVTFTKYADLNFSPRCWYPKGHGDLNVVGAIENSCNFFFFTVSDELTIDPISNMAAEFGLGAETGIEIGERVGHVASREYKRQVLNEGWWNADTLMASIGQSYNLFTPVQIANYVATIANNGVRYKATILDYVCSGNFADILLEKQPEVAHVIDNSDGFFKVIQQGMRAVVTGGMAGDALKNFPVKVCAKTGTVQSDTAAMNTGVFVCYAPADNPEIAIAVVIEKGGSGSNLTSTVADVLTAYFASTSAKETGTAENSLVR